MRSEVFLTPFDFYLFILASVGGDLPWVCVVVDGAELR